MTRPDYIFVYGTLRSESAHPMARRLRAQARLIGKGSTAGLLYDMGYYAAATFPPDDKLRVLGDVFALPKGGKLLAALDAYEGCANGNEAEGLFRRVMVTVEMSGGGALEAWSYAVVAPPRHARLIAGGDFIAHRKSRKPRPLCP
jgi:gamma-glutamylcyclotransferase (GGCT)/AIG2-like uncharacterized protein YtfP